MLIHRQSAHSDQYCTARNPWGFLLSYWTYLINATMICASELVWRAHCRISSQAAHFYTFIRTITTVFLSITCPCQRNTASSTVTEEVCDWTHSCLWQQENKTKYIWIFIILFQLWSKILQKMSRHFICICKIMCRCSS